MHMHAQSPAGEAMKQLQDILEGAVRKGRAPGFCAGVVDRSGDVHIAGAGVRGTDNPAPMTPDTVFMIASCTKALTGVAAMQLVERGLLDLDEPVGDRLPQLKSPRVLAGFTADGEPITRPAKGSITLRRLLTHTSGFGYDFTSADLMRYLARTGQTITGIAEPDVPLMFDPGESSLYGIGIDWTARLIEAASGQTFDAYLAEHIFTPLGMKESSFFPNEALGARKASVHQKLADGSFAAAPFAWPPVRHFMMGGAGLYATTSDYLKFLRAILAHGAPLLKRETFCAMMTNQTGSLPVGTIKSSQPMLANDYEPLPRLKRGHGLAGLINLEPVPGGRSAGSLAWAGIANCYYWADPDAGIAGVLMAQVLPFADAAIVETFNEVEHAAYV